MNRFLQWIALLIALSGTSAAFAQTGAIQGQSFLGGTQASLSGMQSTNYLNGIVPSATITVYLTGTQTRATIYADKNNTPLSNPFTSNVVGSLNPGGWIFWAAINQAYDVCFSGGIAPNTYTLPVCLTGLYPSSQFTVTTGVTNAQGTFPIQVNGVSGTPASGNITISCASGNCGTNFQTQVVPPIAGQYVVIYPTSGVINSVQTNLPQPNPSINTVSAILPYSCPNTLCTPGITQATWSGFSLPSYVLAGNVTAVYGFSISSATASGPMPVPTIACGPLSNGVAPNTFGWSSQQGTGLLSTVTGANIGSVTCITTQHGSLFGQKTSLMNVSNIGLIVYYTGTAPPANTALQIVPPLYLNTSNNTLGIDTATLGQYLYSHTVLGLPTAANAANQIWLIDDGTSSTDCSTGGGSNAVLCYSNGSSWSSFAGGGGSSAWSSLTNPSGNLALTMGANTSTFTFNAATGASDLFSLTDTASNTGTGILLHPHTASGSTEIPFQADANGVGWQVTPSGALQGVGASTSHGITILEGTTLAPSAGNDIISSDSTSHTLKLSNNGGAFSPICTTANGQCASSSIVASAEVVTFSATPTFSTSFNVSRIVLTGNITSFTLGAGADGQSKSLCFAQDATGGRTVVAPASVHGFFTVGATASKWSCQSFVYDNTDSIWLSTTPGTVNQ